MTIDPTLGWILTGTLCGGILSLLLAAAASFTLLSAWVPRMVSFAVGAMLGAAFLHLLPDALSQADSIEGLFATLLAGMLAFFLLEKAALWRHRHEPPAHAPRHRANVLIVIGDGLHNFVDGVLIAAAFLNGTAVGIAATAAIVAHEIPQEVGDFMVLLNGGYSRRKALLLNAASSLTAVIGGLVGYLALGDARNAVPYVVTVAAASFIYIAAADLIPQLNRDNDARSTGWQIVLILLGIAVIAVPHLWLHAH